LKIIIIIISLFIRPHGSMATTRTNNKIEKRRKKQTNNRTDIYICR